MDDAKTKIIQLEATVHALEELLSVSENSFLEESKKLEVANEELKKENTYKLYFEASTDALLILQDGYFVDCNESAVKMLRAKNKSQVLQTHPWELSPEYQPDGRPSLEKANEMINTALKKGSHCFEWCHKRLDGTVFPVDVSLTVIIFEGKKILNCAWRDITERKLAEDELKKHREHLEELVEQKTREISIELEVHKRLENDIRQILDASGDAIKVIDRNYNIIYVNKTFHELKNINDEIIGKKCHKVDPETECFTDNCPLKKILDGSKSYGTEKILKNAKGEDVPFYLNISPYTDTNGEVIGVIKTFRNITEEKKARKAAEENALQQGRIEMANNMLHDIGNALTGISAQVLKPQVEKNWKEVSSLKQLREMLASSEKELNGAFGREKAQALNNFIAALTNSLEKRNCSYLDFFAKISAAVGHVTSVLDLQRHYMRERHSPLAKEINISTIINDSLVMLSESIKKREIEVELNNEARGLTISGDQTRLIRVFLNIIKNIYEAFDQLEPGPGKKLDIDIRTDEKHNQVVISFKDNAIGFDSETAKKLFERGFTTKYNGSGIGLHECKSVIESHGGTFSIESSGVNSGALTTIKLPILSNASDKKE